LSYAANLAWTPDRALSSPTAVGLVAEAQTGAVAPFRALERRVVSMGVAATWAVSENAVFRASYPVQAVWGPDGNRVVGSGDVRIGTSVRFLDRGLEGWIDSLVKLPNAPDEEGLGTDETDWTGQCWVRWNGALRIEGGAGLAILGSPNAFAAQDDALVADLRVFLPPMGPFEVRAEAGGRVWSPDNPSDLRARVGGTWTGQGLTAGAEVAAGLTPAAPDVGVRIWVGLVPGATRP
jgi:hypothetical protein